MNEQEIKNRSKLYRQYIQYRTQLNRLITYIEYKYGVNENYTVDNIVNKTIEILENNNNNNKE